VRISIVMPTRDRPLLLARCLGALAEQDIGEPFEVIVVDDGVDDIVALPWTSFGVGPAAARNVGVEAAQGKIILFTDDDTVPEPNWVGAAIAHLDENPHHVGVEGPTRSAPFDHLYEHSVQSTGVHTFLTCNIAYRREVLVRLGGFYEGFPYPHCEDLDLGLRALAVGEIGTCEDMVVVHPPRPAGLGYLIRRGRLIASELQLMTRHPDLYLQGSTVHPVAVVARRWSMRWLAIGLRERRSLVRSPRRAGRFAVVAAGQLSLAAATIGTTLFRER
jgi:GT2 family glycosyltransferase